MLRVGKGCEQGKTRDGCMGRMSTDSAKPAVAVSACLLGEECTWRGGHNALPADAIARLREACELVPICPEVQGGLPTPRPPSEIVNARPASGDEGVRGTVSSCALANEGFCSADEAGRCVSSRAHQRGQRRDRTIPGRSLCSACRCTGGWMPLRAS